MPPRTAKQAPPAPPAPSPLQVRMAQLDEAWHRYTANADAAWSDYLDATRAAWDAWQARLLGLAAEHQADIDHIRAAGAGQ